MEKVLIILSENNKGKFISKGFSSAFKEHKYFVFERKFYDLNLDDINKMSPNIIFIFWSDMPQKEDLKNFLYQLSLKNSIFIHVGETKSDVPNCFKRKTNHHVFTPEAKLCKYEFVPAINPNDYKSKFEGFKYNITFSGNPAYQNREEILSKLIYNFGEINLFCRSFDFYKSVDEIYNQKLLNDFYLELYKKSYRGYVNSTQELAQIYSSSKINIDIENGSKINYRCFEITASGGFLIAPSTVRVFRRFELGKDVETYQNTDELIDKIAFYLKNLNLSYLIAINGKKNTVSNNSFYDRLKSILKVIYGKDFSNR
jgi:hypothetical protein